MIIVAETNHWVAVHKPAGLMVEPDRFGHPNLYDEVLAHLRTQNRHAFLGVVHRLDRPTSGGVIFAKKRSTLKQLNEQFARRRVRKTYLAVTGNPLPGPAGTLRHFLRKNPQMRRADIAAATQPGAKEARLRYRLVAKEVLLFQYEIQLMTGRYHQIRAQLAAVNCPLVGDEKYGSTDSYKPNAIALHATALTFEDPSSEERMQLAFPPPADSLWNRFAQKRKAPPEGGAFG